MPQQSVHKMSAMKRGTDVADVVPNLLLLQEERTHGC